MIILRKAGVCLWAALPLLAASDFDQAVKPYFAAHCTKCHGEKSALRSLRLDTITPATEAKTWQAIWKQLSLGSMPPKPEAVPDARATRKVTEWIQQRLGGAGSVDPLAQPGFGNYLEHDALFREPAVRKAASPPRLWRISPYIFRESVNMRSQRPVLRIFANQGGNGLHPSLPLLSPAHTFRDYSLPHGFEEATTELMLDMALRVAEYQTDEKRGRPEILRPLQTSPPDYTSAIRAQFDLVLQREPRADEIERLLALASKTEKESGVKSALQTVLAAVQLTPEAVYRFEVGDGDPDPHGRIRLSAGELAMAIAFALTDNLPDAELRAAGKAGKLATRDGVGEQVGRLLADPAVTKVRTLRFFQEFFEYYRAPEVFKSHRLIKHFMPEQMVLDADALVLKVLAEDRDVLKELLTTDRMYVNWAQPGRQSVNRPDKRQKWYYEIYNLPREWEFSLEQPLRFPGKRSGMLTHPAWLLTFSDNENNQAIQRGRWVRTKLLGQPVPDVPIDVNAQLPEDPHKTLRERMTVTRQAYCWTCHSKMDQLGLPFEQFDDFGQYRETDLKRPVNATGSVESGIGGLDGPVQDPFELTKRLANSRHVQQVFVRHAFRYWMGRNEALDDAPSLIDAEQAYIKSGGSIKALIASLLTSDSFLYRKAPPGRIARK